MYRKRTLEQALRIHDKFLKDEQEGVRPVHRPKHWHKEERREMKQRKRHTWGTKGGYISPIIVPSTPGSELLKMLRNVAKNEEQPGLKFKIVERGGTMVKWDLMNTNPSSSGGCQTRDCQACIDGSGKGGPCRKSNVVYEFACQLCPTDSQAVYLGETARNLYTRGREHHQNYLRRHQESFMLKHQLEKHVGVEADFKSKVVCSYQDCLTRQISEGVHIRRCDKNILNSKSEWHQPALWKVRSELSRE